MAYLYSNPSLRKFFFVDQWKLMEGNYGGKFKAKNLFPLPEPYTTRVQFQQFKAEQEKIRKHLKNNRVHLRYTLWQLSKGDILLAF